MTSRKSIEIEPTGKINGARAFQRANRAKKNFWKQEYLALEDPTGYAFAQAWVDGGWEIWKMLTARPEIKEWQAELEVRLQSKGMRDMAARGTLEAARWLAERGWLPKEDKRTKEAKKRAEKAEEEFAADADRLGLERVDKATLKLVKNG